MKKSEMFHIVIDSTYLKNDVALVSPDLLLLTDLSEKRFVKIHIPWIVYKECTTSTVEKIKIKLNGAKNNLQNLKRNGLHNLESEILDNLSITLGKEIDKVEKSVERNWSDFIKKTKAKLYKFNPNDSISVFENYFSGGKPFKSLKSRADIPDAFIYETIREIWAKYTVHLITEDKNLTSCCKDQHNIFVYKDPSEFYNSNNFKNVKSNYESQSGFEQIKLLLMQREEEILTEAYRYIDEIEPSDISMSEDSDITISGIFRPEITLRLNDMLVFTDEIYLPISIKADADIEYFITKSEAMDLPDNSKIELSDWNDHVFLADEFTKVSMSQILIIPIPDTDMNESLAIEFGEYEEIEFV